ncbi:MAG: hypothetical protein WCF06_10625 [Nitrososphaeraceae archaeon]
MSCLFTVRPDHLRTLELTGPFPFMEFVASVVSRILERFASVKGYGYVGKSKGDPGISSNRVGWIRSCMSSTNFH